MVHGLRLRPGSPHGWLRRRGAARQSRLSLEDERLPAFQKIVERVALKLLVKL
jgi:hypothetical protein